MINEHYPKHSDLDGLIVSKKSQSLKKGFSLAESV